MPKVTPVVRDVMLFEDTKELLLKGLFLVMLFLFVVRSPPQPHPRKGLFFRRRHSNVNGFFQNAVA